MPSLAGRQAESVRQVVALVGGVWTPNQWRGMDYVFDDGRIVRVIPDDTDVRVPFMTPVEAVVSEARFSGATPEQVAAYVRELVKAGPGRWFFDPLSSGYVAEEGLEPGCRRDARTGRIVYSSAWLS